MSRSTLEYIRHILDEAEYLLSEAGRTDRERFLQDETLKRAFARSLEIMGEAAKNVPDEFKQTHSHIEWRSITAMRDRLIHHYFGVDYEIVWDVVANKLPSLRDGLKKIIENADEQ